MAGSLGGLEYDLWDAVVRTKEAICSSEEIEQLKYLSFRKVRRMGYFGMNRRKRKSPSRCRSGSGCMKWTPQRFRSNE